MGTDHGSPWIHGAHSRNHWSWPCRQSNHDSSEVKPVLLPVILSWLCSFPSYSLTGIEVVSQRVQKPRRCQNLVRSKTGAAIISKIPNLSLQYLSLILRSSLCSLPSATLSRRLNKTLQYGLVFSTRPYHAAIQPSSDANSPYPPVLSSFTSHYLQF